MPGLLTLKKALDQNRLADFIEQEEARDFLAADKQEVMGAIGAVIKPPRSKDQTSRSPSRDDLPEK